MNPNRFSMSLAAFASLFCILIAYAGPKDFWETKPYTEWSAKEVETILLKNSPWTQTYLPYESSLNMGRPGQVRTIINWYSRPIREALVRQLMLKRPGTPKEQLDQILNHKSEYLELLLTGYSLRSLMNIRGADALARFKEDTCISKEDNTRIPLVNVILDKAGSAATLQFAKEIDGKPTITAQDKEVTLQIRFDDRMYKFKFKMTEMMVRGQLEI